MAVVDAVGVRVGDGLGVAAGVGVREGELDGVAPGDRVGVGVAEVDGLALGGGTLTEKVALAQEAHRPSVAAHSVPPVAHSVTLRVTLEILPQVDEGRGTRMRDTGGASPNIWYWTNQSTTALPLATLPAPEGQASSTPNEQP